MPSVISATPRPLPSASASPPGHAGASGVVRARGALRPLALGCSLAVLGMVAMILGAYLDAPRPSSLMLLIVGALPVLCTLPLVWGHSTSLEITPQGFQCRRFLAPSRSYPASAVIVWGFESAPGVLSTIPPQASFDARRVNFVLETTDGRRFETPLTLSGANRIVTLLMQHQTGLACDRRKTEL